MPVRATITDFGPVLLAKLLGLNATQESSLGLVFHYADSHGLALLDLASEFTTAKTTTLGSGSTKVSCCASGVLENTTLSDGNSDLAGGGDAHGLHHLLDTDSID